MADRQANPTGSDVQSYEVVPSKDAEATDQTTSNVSLLANRITEVEETAKSLLKDVGRQETTVGKLAKKLDENTTLLIVGLGIAILAALGVVAAVFIFFTQTAIDTHRDLNQYLPTITKSNPVPSPDPVFKQLR